MIRNKNNGFWIRLLAIWIDCLMIYALLKAAFYLLLVFSLPYYFPFPFSFFLTFVCYTILAAILHKQTVGKKLLYITSTKPNSIINRLSKIAAIASFVVILGLYLWDISQIIRRNHEMTFAANKIDLPFMHRMSSSTKEISEIKNNQPYVDWLNQHAISPAQYAIQMASKHEVTLFGEMHNNKSNLQFFNSIIEDLYKKSGVKCIGMEAIPYTLNKKIEKLLNGESYDRALALEIARSQPWSAWGDKEYWDVLETVWKLNHSLSPKVARMRIVGLDYDWEGANIALLNIGGNRRGPTAFWEKFRIFPAISDLLKGSNREGLMAYNIQEEMIKKHDKSVVLIGFAHSMLNYGEPIIDNHKLININKRMGVLLNQKYPGKIFQIELFHQFDNDKEGECVSKFAPFIESIMAKRDNSPVGFTISNSPFAPLRDRCTPFFNTYPSVTYEDITGGVIFLDPIRNMPRCTWIKEYISNEMFMKYKPLYELMAKKTFSNAKEVDNYFALSYAH